MDKEDILYNQTQNFGRTQFVRELVKKNEQIINLQQENEQLEKENKQLKQKVNQLETNWNELKKELNTCLKMAGFNSYGITCALGCIQKIEDRVLMNEKIVYKKLSDEEPILIDKKKQILIGITEEEYYEYIYLQQENQQLKENWNKLKEHYNKFRESIKFETWEILDEMQYIEKGDSNDTNR